MADILYLASRRKPSRDPVPAPSRVLGPAVVKNSDLDAFHYYCQKCNGVEFNLFTSGKVNCVGCGTQMNNITCGETSRAERK